MAVLEFPVDLARRLAGQSAGQRPVVLDVRWRLGGPPGRVDYDEGHLPFAVYLDLETDLADPPGAGGRHPLPTPERVGAVFASAGVRDGGSVVCYDDADGSVAARAWWLLRWIGYPVDRVAVLDGGHRRWVAEGLPVSREPVHPTPGRLTVTPGAMPVVDADAVAVLARRGTVLDARAAGRYRGEIEPVDPRAGHIPGARNAPAAEHLGGDGRWRPARELAERYRALGVEDTDEDVAAYCGSGVTASAVVLALEYAGLRPPEHPAALYPGSWSQWSGDQGRPTAVGDEPYGCRSPTVDDHE